MGELTNKDLQDAFMEGFCYAEDIGHTTGKKLAAEAERRYPATAPAANNELLDDAMGLLHNHEQDHDPEWQKDYEDVCRRYDAEPAAANAEGLLTLLKRFAVNYSLRMIEKGHELETCNCDACTDIRKARELTADAALRGEGGAGYDMGMMEEEILALAARPVEGEKK